MPKGAGGSFEMTRTAFWPSSAVLLLGLLALPACAQQDSPEAVVADCSGPIPREKVDSCLERARVLDETNPSPQMQSLEAQLELRERHHDMAQGAPPPSSDGSYQGPTPGYGQDQGPPPGYGDNQPPPPPQDYGSGNQMPSDQATRQYEGPPPDDRMNDQSPPVEGPTGDMAPPSDQAGPGDVSPPDDGAQGPPPDNTPPPDDSNTRGPGQ
jgi:hypothetical protein